MVEDLHYPVETENQRDLNIQTTPLNNLVRLSFVCSCLITAWCKSDSTCFISTLTLSLNFFVLGQTSEVLPTHKIMGRFIICG